MEAILAEYAGRSQVCSVVGADCSDSECKEEEAEGRAHPQLGDTAVNNTMGHGPRMDGKATTHTVLDAPQKDQDTFMAAGDSPEAKPMGTPDTASD
ncbi:hypothetical protein SRHO_G00097970 [Serrasalmus rhombeus]